MVISLTDNERSKLPPYDAALYEAYHAVNAILNWHNTQKSRSAESYIVAIHQCAIAENCIEHYWQTRKE